MAEHDFPEIEPSTFDMIVVGTGLQESIMAAAAASAGHTVLHLDPCNSYGLHWTSLSLDEFTQWAKSNGSLHKSYINPINASQSPPKLPDKEDLEVQPLTENGSDLYSDFELKSFGIEEASRGFNLDISGPKLAFCRGPMVDLLLRAGASNYLEFKSVEGSFIWTDAQGLVSVPDSRASIFQDRVLSLVEKRHLMRFFKLVQNHGNGLSDEVLEGKFLDLLDQQRLPLSIKSMILYAIALVDHDQEDESQGASTILKAKDGIESLVLYLSSIGRFVNASGAFLYPVYGQAELPQAFCRTAAVKGAIYVLRMPVTGLLVGKESRKYKGVQTASGQYLFSDKLVLSSSIGLQSDLSSSVSISRLNETESEETQLPGSLKTSMVLIKDTPVRIEQMPQSKVSWKVARSVCITNQSLKPDLSTILVVFPPRSIFKNHRTTIRALQLGSNTSVCPKGMVVVYFSTLCADTIQGKEVLLAAMNSLFTLPDRKPEIEMALSLNDSESEGRKPTLLWYTFFVQKLTEDEELLSGPITKCCMPDETLDYRRLVMSTTKMFQNMLATDELFAQTESEDIMENEEDYTEDTLLN